MLCPRMERVCIRSNPITTIRLLRISSSKFPFCMFKFAIIIAVALLAIYLSSYSNIPYLSSSILTATVPTDETETVAHETITQTG